MLDKIVFGSVTVLHLLFFAAILITSLIASRVTLLYLRRNLRGRVDEDRFQLISKLINYGLIGLTFLVAMPLLGINFGGLAVAGGLFGVIIGFASQNVVSNFISGLFVMMERPIRIGNAVNMGDTEGVVEEIRLMSTIIRTFDGLRIRIPNINVFTSILVNHEAFPIRRAQYIIGIRYRDDATKAMNILRQTLEAEAWVLNYPEPSLFVKELADSSVNISVRFWVPTSEFWTIKFKMLLTLKLAIEAQGIQIPFPQRVIWQGDGD